MSPRLTKPVVHGRDHAPGGSDPIPGGVGGSGSPAPPWDFSSTNTIEYAAPTTGVLLFDGNWGTPGDGTSFEISYPFGSQPYYHIPIEGVDTGNWARRHIIAFPPFAGETRSWHEVMFLAQFQTWTLVGDPTYNYDVWMQASLQSLGYGPHGSGGANEWAATHTVYLLDTNENIPARPPALNAPDAATFHTRYWRGLFEYDGGVPNGYQDSMMGMYARFSFNYLPSSVLDFQPSGVYVAIYIKKLSYPFPDPYTVSYPTS